MKKLGFLQKQVAIYSLLTLVVMAVLIFWAHSYIMDISMEKAVINQEQMTSAVLEHVDSYLDQLMLVATQTAHDSEIVKIMEQLSQAGNDSQANYFLDNQADRERIAEILGNHNTTDHSIVQINLYNGSGDFICTTPSGRRLQSGAAYSSGEKHLAQLKKVFVTDGREFLMMGPISHRLKDAFGISYDAIFMMMPVRLPDSQDVLGYVEVYQSLEPLYEKLETDQQSGMEIYLFIEVNLARGKQFYPKNIDFPDTSQGRYYETERQSGYGWYVVLLQNQAEFLAPYHRLLIYLCLGGLALFLLLLACVYLLVRHTSRPILELSQRVRETTLTNPPGTPVSGASDEVKELARSVDSMIQRLKASVALEQQAYLKALQAQMDPHFLYNCLSTISALGAEADVEAIPRFCLHLAAMLRYETTYQNDLVTLNDELKNVRDYLTLMKIRYEDHVSYEIEAEDSLLTLPLPRLVLQPLVENCFRHGFQGVKPPWRLSIRAFRQGAQWEISIADNGIGFRSEQLERLQEQTAQLMRDLSEGAANLKIGGLGLASTIVRLRLMAEQKTDFSITPNTPSGTIVTLRGEYHDTGFSG